MTDTTPRATVCDVEGCHALIPVSIEDRREHRRGHTKQAADYERLRRTASEATQAVRELTKRLEELERDVADIDIPAPVDPFTIVDAEDLEPIDDETDPDQQPSQYAADEDADPAELPDGTDPSSSDYTGDSDPYDDDEHQQDAKRNLRVFSPNTYFNGPESVA